MLGANRKRKSARGVFSGEDKPPQLLTRAWYLLRGEEPSDKRSLKAFGARCAGCSREAVRVGCTSLLFLLGGCNLPQQQAGQQRDAGMMEADPPPNLAVAQGGCVLVKPPEEGAGSDWENRSAPWCQLATSKLGMLRYLTLPWTIEGGQPGKNKRPKPRLRSYMSS